ncbi:N-acetylmuramoyl-L-alanine amidase [Nocardioides aequoreus]|uniref:N-acetylmuramoyl-L-alanine amidase n=1 Tax=Nocardioides aequoreus TaxID=397278 RepID=UPI0004C34478|nr:peptidoglycan-binding protein [Nocardioides aequoreus]
MDVVCRRGDTGPAVTRVTALLGRLGLLEVEAVTHGFDERVELAVRDFQQQRGLSVDGVVGPDTYRRLEEARWDLGDRILTHLPGDLMVGDDVSVLQRRLLDLGFGVLRVDGYFGPQTEDAVREFQRNTGLPPDGTCGPATLKALARLAPIVRGGAPGALRDAEHIRDVGPNLTGRTVVVDVGRTDHLPADLADEHDAILHDLAGRVEGRLVAIGVQAYLSAPRGAVPRDDAERAAFANRTRADLFLSLALDTSENPQAKGCSTYFFGGTDPASWSSAGERFAGLVQREIVARTDLLDLRSHAKAFELLRRTEMPAVRLDAGYLTNTSDRARLEDPDFRDQLAEALVVAVQRFYLTPDVDAHTGVLSYSELRAAYTP